MVTYCLATTDDEIRGILALQQQNLARHLTTEQILSQGFVTVEHDFPLLQRMNDTEGSIIAKDDNKVIGYCLAMIPEFRNDIPILEPMFDTMDHLQFKGKSLGEYTYIVSGQVCIADGYRGLGIFDKMYQTYQKYYAPKYDFILTEISERNQRSLKAHLRVGFEMLHRYFSPDGEEWVIVLWEWGGE